MRYKLNGTFRDEVGNLIAGGTVSVKLAGTNTAAAVYATETGTVSAGSVTTGSDGTYTFYVSNFDYDAEQRFKIVCTKTGYTTKTYDYVGLFDAVIKTYSITVDTVVSTHLIVPKGVIYAVATGVTLTINGAFDAGLYQVFSITGTGNVVFGSGSVQKARPEWWAANTAPGTTDMAAAINYAAASGASIVELGGTSYGAASKIIIPDNVHLKGAGKLSTIIKQLAGTWIVGTAVVINSNYADAATGNTGITISDLYVDGLYDTPSELGGAVAGVLLYYCKDSEIRNVKTSDTWHGVGFNGVPTGTVVANNKIIGCTAINADSWSSAGSTGVPRGIIMRSSDGIVENNYTEDCDTGFYISSAHVKVNNNTARWGTVHTQGYYITVGSPGSEITNNTAWGGVDAATGTGNGFIIAYAEGSLVQGNKAYFCGNQGFRIHIPQKNTRIIGNYAYGCGFGYRVEETSEQWTVSSLTQAAGTATAVTATEHGYVSGQTIVISGAAQTEYNGYATITVTNTTTFTYTVDVGAVSPATGTILSTAMVSGIQLIGNIAENSKSIGIVARYMHNSVISGNILINGNTGGVTIGIRGTLSLQAYVKDCRIYGNVSYDFDSTHSGYFGFYNYAKAASGAHVENTGNYIEHKSQTGTDYYGVVNTGNINNTAIETYFTWNVGSLADGVGETSGDITLTGAALGDIVHATPSLSLQGLLVSAYVKTTNIVAIRVQNETGGPIDLNSTSWRVRLIKQ